jgi:hypothetical protein
MVRNREPISDVNLKWLHWCARCLESLALLYTHGHRCKWTEWFLYSMYYNIYSLYNLVLWRKLCIWWSCILHFSCIVSFSHQDNHLCWGHLCKYFKNILFGNTHLISSRIACFFPYFKNRVQSLLLKHYITFS